MSWKKLICFMGIGLLVLCFSSTGFAGDSDKRLEILIQAPIDEVNCQHSTPTIMVLGLPIDVSDAAFTVKGQKSSITCWDISGGLTAAVTLTGDTADEETGLLTATDVEIQTAAENPVKINAPLEAVDASGTTVSVLGLTVDISSAVLLNDFKHPITASQLKADQFARIAITPDSDPLAATKVQVRINQVSVQAPIEAISCDSSPATITLLGLKMDVSKAVFGPRWHKAVVSCSDLEAGQVVEAYLTSDISDSATGLLTATQVDLREGWWFWGRGRGCHYQPVKINAPLQGVDPNTNSVTVLGLPVDAQYAWIFDEQLETVGLSQLKAGQFAKLTLLPDSLTALTILAHVDEVKVKAPVTAIDCDNETITVLGLPVDVTSATFGSKWDWHWGGGKRNCYHRGLTCRSLKVGQTVAVELTGDLSGTYAAKEVEVRGSRDDDVMISGPVDSADPSGKTVTVLGLTIDMSAAKLRDDNGHPSPWPNSCRGSLWISSSPRMRPLFWPSPLWPVRAPTASRSGFLTRRENPWQPDRSKPH